VGDLADHRTRVSFAVIVWWPTSMESGKSRPHRGERQAGHDPEVAGAAAG
jgi:hypothetical protein